MWHQLVDNGNSKQAANRLKSTKQYTSNHPKTKSLKYINVRYKGLESLN